MNTGPVKPRSHFKKLLDMPEEQIDYADNPPTARSDWADAEFLLPVTRVEFRAIEQFVRRRRSRKSAR